jgi:hypothetical protein
MEALQECRERDNMADKEVVTKDYWTIILMGSVGLSPENIEENEKDSGSIEKVYTFAGEDACDLHRRYISGEPIEVDFHNVERSANLFKKNLRPQR